MNKIYVKRILTHMADENCYIIYKNNKGIIVDPGLGFSKIKKIISELNIDIEAIILTHAHFDHILSLEECREYFNVDVYISKKENEWLENPDLNCSKLFGLPVEVVCKRAEHEFEEYKEYTLADMTFKVLPTPGHSPGSLSFDFGEFIIVGDALFKSGYGRYDLPGGDYYALKNSLQNILYKLDGNKIVYSGHGDETTIERERELNLI